jgi:hypothetical protein
MAVILPPTPIGVPPGHSFWNDWYEKLRSVINTGAISITWANINFAGSALGDLASRPHSALQSIQGGTGGEYYHLTAAQHASLGVGNHNTLLSIQGGAPTEYYHLTTTQHGRATSVLSLSVDPTTSEIAASEWALYKNTTSGLVKLWTNDGGVMKSVVLL